MAIGYRLRTQKQMYGFHQIHLAGMMAALHNLKMIYCRICLGVQLHCEHQRHNEASFLHMDGIRGSARLQYDRRPSILDFYKA